MKKNYIFAFFCFISFPFLAFSQPSNWASRGIGGGGALFAPSINPANPDEMYVSCDMSQTYHSTDRGLHWTLIPFTQVQGGHDGFVSFTNNPLKRYTLHYYSNNGSDYIKPVKTTDGGNTWTTLPGDPFSGNPSGYVLRLFCDFQNPDRIVLADYGTIWFSSDGGNNFSKIHTCINNGSGNHIAGVFFDGNNIYIGTNDGIIYSTNAGSNFNIMTTSGLGSGEILLSFSGARSGTKVRFLCLTSTSVWAGYQYASNYNNAMKGVYIMDNASGTWNLFTTGITSNTDYPVFTGMAANCTDTLYLGGGSSASGPIVMRSIKGGNWTHVFKTASNNNVVTGWAGAGGDHAWSFPEAPFGFQVDPADARRVIFSDYSCVHITSDAGNKWYQRYTDSADGNNAGSNTPTGKKYHSAGLENTTCWQVFWNDSSHLLSAFSDINGVMSDDKGKSWKFIPNLTQNSVYRIAKTSNGFLYAATSNVHDIYQTTRIYDVNINAGKGGVWQSKDGGNSWQLFHDFQHPVIWVEPDPLHADRLYAAVLHSNKSAIGGIWVTDNLSAGPAATWTKLSQPTRANGHPYNIHVLPDGNLLVSYSARKPTSGSQFTDSSGVYYYNVTSSKWYDRSHANMKWYTKDVVADPNDATGATWYACVFSGWGSAVPAGTGGLYRTRDTGKTWTKIVNSYRVDGVSIEPGNSNHIYFTTETDGLFYSQNGNNASPAFNLVSSYPFRHPMRVFFNPKNVSEIWVTAFGNGMMVSNAGSSAQVQNLPLSPLQLQVWPNPSQGALHIKLPQGTDASVIEIYSTDGRCAERIPLQKGEKEVWVTPRIPLHGIYFIRAGSEVTTVQFE